MTGASTRGRWWWPQGSVCGGFPVPGRRWGRPAVNGPAATKEARHWTREFPTEKEKRAPRNGVIMGWQRGAP